MTTIEVMRKALEALEHAEKDATDFQRINTDQTGAAITALRAELERIEGVEPVAWQRRVFLDGKWEEWTACEPLADGESMDYTYPDSRVRYQFRKLYTAPIAQRRPSRR